MKETINFKENQERIRERYQAKKIALKKQERNAMSGRGGFNGSYFEI